MYIYIYSICLFIRLFSKLVDLFTYLLIYLSIVIVYTVHIYIYIYIYAFNARKSIYTMLFSNMRTTMRPRGFVQSHTTEGQLQ